VVQEETPADYNQIMSGIDGLDQLNSWGNWSRAIIVAVGGQAAHSVLNAQRVFAVAAYAVTCGVACDHAHAVAIAVLAKPTA